MKPIELTVARIGNSRGVRIPAKTLERYRIRSSVVMEERSDGILLRPSAAGTAKLSWEQTADAMALAAEDWTDWEVTAADGLDAVPWVAARRQARSGAEQKARRGRSGGRR